MFLGTFAIDEYVNIPAVTHRFSSGAAYAPTSITYSIYEEGNTTGIDEDVDMAPASPFDSVAGLYLARRQLTAAAGFEANKTYLVVVKATVDGIAAIDAHLFQVRPIQSGDSYAIVSSGTYGNSAIKTQLADIHDTDLPAVKADTAAILEDTGTTLPGTLTDIHGHITAAPTASEIADAVLDEALSGHLTAGTLGRKINDLSSSSGSGSIEWDLPNVYKTGTTTPIADVDVWITTDEAGDNVIASGKTDAYGTCKFYLDAGKIYVWCQKTGVNFTNPTEYTVA